MKSMFNKAFKNDQKSIESFIENFNTTGEVFGNEERNTIKIFKLNGETVNIKSFKTPNIFNQIVYRFFRKSKAQRSFEYATKLEALNVGTPQPIAYFEFPKTLLFKRSFYVSEHLECDLTYRELINDFNYPDYDTILRVFTRFTYSLHEKGINFLDHSPGNTLIKKIKDGYEFYLVDLNRMKFEPMDFEARMKNFARLSEIENMIEIMSDEYAIVSGEKYTKVYEAMSQSVNEFRDKINRKNQLKKTLRFWKVG